MTKKHLGRLSPEVVEKLKQQSESTDLESNTDTPLVEKIKGLIEKNASHEHVPNESDQEAQEYLKNLSLSSVPIMREINLGLASTQNTASIFQMQNPSQLELDTVPRVFNSTNFEDSEKQRMKRLNQQSVKLSKFAQQERERIKQIDTDRHDQLISAVERIGNKQQLAYENTQLKAELEKLKDDNSKLLNENKKLRKNQNIESTRAKNNLLDIIYVLADMANLPIDNPFKSYGVMQAHADTNNLKIPSKDTVSKWLEDSKNKNK